MADKVDDMEAPTAVAPAEPAQQDKTDESPNEPEKANSSEIVNRTLSIQDLVLLSLGALFFFWVFLVGLTVMGSAFKILGGSGAADLFKGIQDPISGLMIGVLATVLVQSSSTSTSIVVAMTTSGILTVKQGIPIIFGANIGTTVTATIVSVTFVGNRVELQRAFQAATCHTVFNFLAVATWLPIEVIIGEINGKGGPLFWFTDAVAEAAVGGQKTEKLFKSPVKIITSPVADMICKSNKYVIYGRTLPRPESLVPTEGITLCQTCESMKGIVYDNNCTFPEKEEEDGRRLLSSPGDLYTRSLLSKRRLEESTELADCGEYACVSSKLAGYYEKANQKAFEKIQECDQFITGHKCPSEKDSCFIQGTQYYDKYITKGALIKGGFLQGAGDVAGGILGVIISLFLLSGGLIGLTKCLSKVFMSKAKKVIDVTMLMNGYVGILVGLGITIIVQSSSVTTSALTPLAAIGVLPLVKMFPMTLGANVGTTTTALIASLVEMKKEGVQIAFCHFFFNSLAILIWFPVPALRKLPLAASRTFGLYAAHHRMFPIVYLLFAFLFLPVVAFAVLSSFRASIALGAVLLVVFILLGLAVGVWWNVGFGSGPGCYRVLSKEAREEAFQELLKEDAKIMGVTPDEWLAVTAVRWTG